MGAFVGALRQGVGLTRMLNRLWPAFLAIAAASAAIAAPPPLDRQFEQTVRPFINKHCAGCHSGATPAAQFDLKGYTSLAMVTRDYPRWALVLERLEAKDMPPKPMAQPSAESSHQVMEWIQALRKEELRKSAGDPGLVLARRLSNSEYNYTVRDLTGQDLQPTREFPVDPANQAGFDNSGESLTMSPALLNKYLQAARGVASHLVLTPEGMQFAPFPMQVETDREKYAVQKILKFYDGQPTDYADYFQAAWRYQHKQGGTLTKLAAEAKLSPKYLPMVWGILNEKDAVGPVAKLQKMFRALPGPGAGAPEEVRKQCVAMRDFVVRLRNHTAMQFAAPLVKGLPAGSQPLLNWKLKQFSLHHRDSEPKYLVLETDPPAVAPVIPRFAGLHQEAAPRWAAVTAKARIGDADLVIPAAERARYEAAFQRLATVFPDKFFVRERGRFWPDETTDKGRFLSAGYHSVLGFYRDDAPLSELILDEKAHRELNSLWDEFDFVAQFTDRTWVQYFFNQSGEVDGKGAESASPRPVDYPLLHPTVIGRMRDAYLAKAAADSNNDPVAPQAIREHFDGINATLRRLEKMRAEGEPKQIEALHRFTARAYRRPVTKAERDGMVDYYQKLREKNGLTHEDAIRDCVVSVLMSPDYLYRLDLVEPTVRTVAAKGAPSQALSSYALASRLSYFLWSSMPDDELLAHAAAGDLRKPEVLQAQTRRLLKDERARGMATEFGGNWLDFRRFENNNTVDRERFPKFNNQLREAMFQEPVRFLQNLINNDLPIFDLVYGKYTFVNPTLAKYYGMPEVKGTDETWVKADDAASHQRGGLLPMAAFLTQSSPGLRTSPVKRGYWVVRRVLGEVIPPPPPVVPELPHDEAKSDTPLREVLAQHRANVLCAGCHARFDTFGLALEGYGPVGEARTMDLAGRPVDTKAVFPGGSEGSGVEGIIRYIRQHRQPDFVDNLSRKLVAYGLNRSLQLSDEAVVDQIKAILPKREFRFQSIIETIVASPQFLNRRKPEMPQTQSRRGE